MVAARPLALLALFLLLLLLTESGSVLAATDDDVCRDVDACPLNDDHVTVTRRSTPLRRHLEQSCFCDRICRVMRDCCSDSDVFLGIDVVARDAKRWSHLSGIENHFQCSPIGSVSGIKYVSDQLHKTYLKDIYMVSSCPDDYENSIVSDKCSDTTRTGVQFDSDKDHFDEWPVTSNFSGIWYRNVFCATCWQERELVFWSAATHCARATTAPVDFLAFEVAETTAEVAPCSEDSYMYLSPTGFHNLRSCVEPPVVTTCSDSWTKDDALRRNCEEGYRIIGPLVYDDNSIPYSNLDCYKCNYRDINDVRCGRNLTNYIEHNYDDFLAGMFPITVLFDPKSQRAGRRGASSRCPDDYIYDAFTKTCKRIYCPNSTLLLDEGPCPLVDLNNCSRISVGSDDYVVSRVGGNATLSDSYNDVVLTVDKYVIENATLVLITCEKFLASRIGSVTRTEAVDVATLVSVVSQLISIICLLMNIVVYALLPKLRNTPGKTLMSLVVSLLLAQLVFLVGAGRTGNRTVCFGIAVVIHYCTLAAFFWMNALAIDLALTFTPKMRQRSRKSMKKRFLYFSLYAWLGPLVLVGVSNILEFFHERTTPFNPNYAGRQLCWLSNIEGLVLLFIVPIAFLLTINVVLYIYTTTNIIRASKVGAKARETNTTNLAIYVKLSFIMGIAWIFAFLWMLTRNEVIRYVFIVANGLQGLFLFVSFVCRKRVYHQALVRLGRRQEAQDSKNRSGNSCSSNYNTNRLTDESRAGGSKGTTI